MRAVKTTHPRPHHRNELLRFTAVLAVLVAYAAFTIQSYGIEQGLGVTGLTWAFFVFATPIADGGFLIAFPIRLITGIRMLYTQVGVWLFGVALVASYLIYSPGTFDKTPLLELFHMIIVTPWPLSFILVLSAIGTFISIKFDDDVVDVATAKHKAHALRRSRRKLYLNVAIFVSTFILYLVLLSVTGIDIKTI